MHGAGGAEKASAPEAAGEKSTKRRERGQKKKKKDSFVAGGNSLLQHSRHTSFQFCFLYHNHQAKHHQI